MKNACSLWTIAVAALLAAGTVVLPACKRQEPAAPLGERQEQGEEAMSMTITSSAFAHGQAIPTRHTGDGADVSPPLAWSGVPKGAVELALICDDPDAPRPEPWVHWVLYKVSASTAALPEGLPGDEKLSNPAGAMQGVGTSGSVGYLGPSPPRGHGVHHYRFHLYALDKALPLGPRLTKEQLLAAMKGHIVAEAELVGTYRR